MTLIKKIFSIFLASATTLCITTCSTNKRTVVSDAKSKYQIKYPSLLMPSLSAQLSVDIPTPPTQELCQTNRRPITTRFSAFQTENIRTTDPLLFGSGNSMIIDFKKISDENYAFPLPGGKVISGYGGRRKGHSGIDIKTCANDTIVSAFDGIVRMSSPYAAYGKVIVVRHYNGLETIYSHNSKNLVKPGDIVHAGQAIALTGRTGRATTEHLHFEVRVNGEHVNPTIFFDMKNRSLNKKCFLCVRKGNQIAINPIDPFPFQEQYLSTYH